MCAMMKSALSFLISRTAFYAQSLVRVSESRLNRFFIFPCGTLESGKLLPYVIIVYILVQTAGKNVCLFLFVNWIIFDASGKNIPDYSGSFVGLRNSRDKFASSLCDLLKPENAPFIFGGYFSIPPSTDDASALYK